VWQLGTRVGGKHTSLARRLLAGRCCCAATPFLSPLPLARAEAAAAAALQALTQLYSVLNTLGEQLALAKTEVWVSGCGGRPLLLPGESPGVCVRARSPRTSFSQCMRGLPI
jgi:hypothetical protein